MERAFGKTAAKRVLVEWEKRLKQDRLPITRAGQEHLHAIAYEDIAGQFFPHVPEGNQWEFGRTLRAIGFLEANLLHANGSHEVAFPHQHALGIADVRAFHLNTLQHLVGRDDPNYARIQDERHDLKSSAGRLRKEKGGESWAYTPEFLRELCRDLTSHATSFVHTTAQAKELVRALVVLRRRNRTIEAAERARQSASP